MDSETQTQDSAAPGPWREEDDGLYIAASDGTFVASFIVPESAEIAADRETRLANHRLIAAAPELLEALEELTYVRNGRTLRRARAAIKKARK